VVYPEKFIGVAVSELSVIFTRYKSEGCGSLAAR
jgi:hypothetical protein